MTVTPDAYLRRGPAPSEEPGEVYADDDPQPMNVQRLALSGLTQSFIAENLEGRARERRAVEAAQQYNQWFPDEKPINAGHFLKNS